MDSINPTLYLYETYATHWVHFTRPTLYSYHNVTISFVKLKKLSTLWEHSKISAIVLIRKNQIESFTIILIKNLKGEFFY